MRLAGKVAVVTGAGRGIGEAATLALAREGAAVGVFDLDGEAAERVAAAIRAEGLSAMGVGVDVTDFDRVDEAMRATVAHFGGLHVVFNNAGVMFEGSVDATPAEEWAATIAVNLTGVFHGCKAAIPLIRTSGGGSIINSGSTSALAGRAEYAAYAASKGGVVSFTRALAVEVARDGIRANVICPGTTATHMVQAYLEDTIRARPRRDGETLDEYRAPLAERNPIGRIAEPEEIAAVVLFLASSESSFITGATLVADGGFTAGPVWPAARQSTPNA